MLSGKRLTTASKAMTVSMRSAASYARAACGSVDTPAFAELAAGTDAGGGAESGVGAAARYTPRLDNDPYTKGC